MELSNSFSALMRATEDFTCLLADQTALTYAVSAEIRAVNRQAVPITGKAFTVRTHGLDLAAVFQALSEAPAGSVLVIDARGSMTAAFTGDRVSEQARQRGLAGIIIDGCCRDVEGINRLGFPVYARGAFPAPAVRTGTGLTGVPVSLAGVPVSTGDLVAADANGVVVAPAAGLSQLLEAVENAGPPDY